MGRILSGWLFTLCLLAGGLRADQVTLANGDRVSGAIVKADATALTVQTDAMGTVTIALASVASIASDQPLYLEIRDGQTVSGALLLDGPVLQVHSPDDGLVELAREEVRAIRCRAEQESHLAREERFRDPGPLDLWSGFLEAGFSLASGNTDTVTFTLGANAARETPRDKTTLYVSSLYAENNTAGVRETTARALRGGARYDLFFGDRMSVFAFGDLDHDDFQGLDLRLALGGGLGRYITRTERTRLQVFGGGNLNQEYFEVDPDRTSAEMVAGGDFSARLTDRLGIKQRFVLFPNLSEGGEYRFAYDAAAVTALNRWLDWHVSLSNRFISNPAEDAERNDLLLTTGVRMRFQR